MSSNIFQCKFKSLINLISGQALAKFSLPEVLTVLTKCVTLQIVNYEKNSVLIWFWAKVINEAKVVSVQYALKENREVSLPIFSITDN